MKEMKIVLGENKKVEARYKGMTIYTDQPEKAGGDESAPAPFDLFLASIGTCAGFYVQAFCNQRGISTDHIELVQKMHHNKETKMISKIEIYILLPPDFPAQYKNSVIRAAESCTVKKHIASSPEFVLNVK